MAGFGGGLVQGFQVGDAARARRVQEGRQAESDQWAREDRARLTRDRDIEDQIRAAGAEAMSLRDVQQPVPQIASPEAVSVAPVATPGAGGPAAPTGALGVESNAAPGMDTAPRAAPAGPAPQQPAMPRAQAPDELSAANRSLKAMSDKAAQLGRADLALDYHIKGMKVREQLRQRAADNARMQYEATGDVGVYRDFINDYMPGDVRFSAITKDGDGYTLAGEKAGQPFQTRMKPEELRSFIGQVTNPDVQRALEAKRAEQLYQIRVEQAKKGPTVVAPGSTAVFPSGQTFTAPEKPEFKTVKNADGSESLVRVGGGGATSIFGGTDQSQDIPKPVRDMQNDVRGAVFSMNKIDQFANMSPEIQKKVGEQQTLASDLIAANYGTDNWRGMSAGKAADIAARVLRGEIKVQQFRVQGIDQPVRGVEFEGRKYLLDPFVRAPVGGTPDSAPQKGVQAPGAGVSITPVHLSNTARALGMDDAQTGLALSIFQQESSSGAADTSKPNDSRVRGPMQVQKETFEGLKKNGLIPEDYDWANPQHNAVAGLAHIKQLFQEYQGDPRKVAAVYYSGPKAVGPNGEIRDLRDPKNKNAPTTLQYVKEVLARIPRPFDPSQLGLGTRAVSGAVGRS